MTSLSRVSRAVGTVCALLTIAIGAIALAGWVLRRPRMTTLFVGDISIKTNTAIALLCVGLSLACLIPARRRLWLIVIARLLAVVPIGIGVLTLAEHLFAWDLGIDQLLFQEAVGAAATTSPNRMGPPASLCFPLLGFALLLLDRQSRRGRSPAQMLALVVVVIAFIPLLGFVFDVRELYGVARFTGIAPSTAFALVISAFGLLFARPDVGWMRSLLADDSGGWLLRRLTAASLLLPIALGRLRIAGEDMGLYDTEFGRSLLILSFIVAFTAIGWWTGTTVQKHAAARARAEAAEHEMQQRLLATLESERNARTVAERSNRMKDEFLATLSHELRTPLQAMLGWVHVLGQGALEPADARRGLEAIERNARLQAQLIEDLLDMSRIELGKVRLDVQDVDLTLIIESALAAAAPAAAARGLSIDRQIDPDVGIVRGDPARLQQVLWNLISNALKFTQRGGRVVISLRKTPTHVELGVADTGIGISQTFLGQVFDRFRQADASTTRRHGGLGLGLSIARHLTELHGGTLEAASEGIDRGATFTIRLPYVAALPLETAVPRPAPVQVEAVEPSAVSLDGMRVLVVDDQPDACELTEHVLSDRGAVVTTATTVDEAIDWLIKRRFDVLVSDISMPGRDGYDLIEYVRNQFPALPAIALTAFAREEDARRALSAGFDRHLAKPISPSRLLAALSAVAARPHDSSVA